MEKIRLMSTDFLGSLVADVLFVLCFILLVFTKYQRHKLHPFPFCCECRDLLDATKNNLQVKENRAKGIFIAGVTEVVSVINHLLYMYA